MNKRELISSLKNRGFSRKILNAFAKVPREKFVPENLKFRAYEDTALPIGQGQTISQPYTIAIMLSMLDVKKGQKVLEIGSGCGYVLALLSEIVGDKNAARRTPNCGIKGQVFGIEIIKELAEHSRINLQGKGIKIYNKNGADGLEEEKSYDRILISAAIEKIPKKILKQLKDKGIIVAPVGAFGIGQSLTSIQRDGNNFTIKEEIPGFVFVRFINES